MLKSYPFLSSPVYIEVLYALVTPVSKPRLGTLAQLLAVVDGVCTRLGVDSVLLEIGTLKLIPPSLYSPLLPCMFDLLIDRWNELKY